MSTQVDPNLYAKIFQPTADGDAMGRDPNLIATIRRHIAANGVVGEEDNALLVYLCYTSRLLDNPAAIVVRGMSSLGKSHLLNRVASLFPDSTKIDAMGMTDASLFNTPEDFFRHKILISGERKHSQGPAAADSTAILRQLLSEKKITRLVCGRNQETQEVVRHGPIAYAESTTASSIFAEDLNRMLQLFLDPSAEQTRRVMLKTASRYDQAQPQEDLTAIIARHHDFQESLECISVHVPFATDLAAKMPAHKPEARRVFPHILTIIEAVTLLHQLQREPMEGCLWATLEDYSLARQLLLPSVRAVLGIGEEFEKARKLHMALDGKTTFTSADVTAAMNYPHKMGAKRLLDDLLDAKLVTCASKAKGQTPATYQWANDVTLDVLPPVEQLAAKPKNNKRLRACVLRKRPTKRGEND